MWAEIETAGKQKDTVSSDLTGNQPARQPTNTRIRQQICDYFAVYVNDMSIYRNVLTIQNTTIQYITIEKLKVKI